nr:unnamed protein product [Digitaria exilis]
MGPVIFGRRPGALHMSLPVLLVCLKASYAPADVIPSPAGSSGIAGSCPCSNTGRNGVSVTGKFKPRVSLLLL